MKTRVRYDFCLLTDHDIYLFKEGRHFRLYEKMGAHIVDADGKKGVCFSVWAPNANRVSVMGDFNQWNRETHLLKERTDGSGIWEGFIPGIPKGTLYKYYISSKMHGYRVDKGDPFAFYWEAPPRTASIVWDLEYSWGDGAWMKERSRKNDLGSPISIYEVHAGSWRRVPEEEGRVLTYRELANRLPDYVSEMGFTHVEFLPLLEHPFFGSWGYQATGFFAPTAKFGSPQDFMFLVDSLHRKGIGVILDWVPSHFPEDQHGLAFFDGTHLFEHADPRQGYHPDWGSSIFNFGRYEVREFLISGAKFLLEKYHIDGLRVDAVASMLYLDYSRRGGDWIPNRYGGNENIEAISFLRDLNEFAFTEHPDVQMIAEESTSWPMVSRPVYLGGLGFGLKWNMGWMHDTLEYFKTDPLFRSYHHDQLTFSLWYAFFENFVLSLSHDEVVHGKGSLIGKMPGDFWQKFANVRLLFGYMFGHPGKKLLFMGMEFGQWNEWDHDSSLEWHLLQYPPHQGLRHWVRDLNRVYRASPSLYEMDFSHDGFEWVDFHDWKHSVISFFRKAKNGDDRVLVVCNFTPVERKNYRVGVPFGGWWEEILNSDAAEYGGAGFGNSGGVDAAPIGWHGRAFSVSLTLPPLGILFLKHKG